MGKKFIRVNYIKLKERNLLSTDMNNWLTQNYSELPNYAVYNFVENRWEARENPRE